MMVGMALMPTTNTDASTPASNELRVAMQMDMTDLNMFNLGSDSMWKSAVLQWAFEGLATVDYDQRPFPLLAQGWEFDEDSLTLIVQLRQDVLFHDGSALTAEDVVFTYSALRAGTTYSDAITNAFDTDDDWLVSQAEIDASVFAIDTYTIAMQLAKPYRDFFTDTLTIPIIPSSVWADHVIYGGIYDGMVDWTWSAPEAAIGTGPFQYDDGIPNEYRKMVKYDGYWGASLITPNGYSLSPANIDSIRFEVLAIDDAVSALRAGTIDLIGWSLGNSRAASLETDGNVNIHYLEDNGLFYLGYNMKREPMNSLGFRKAVEHLIDKDKIASEYAEGFSVGADYFLSDYWGAWQSDSPVPYPHDPTLQSSIDALEDAGFVDADGDGWRDLPDGSPMDALTIICPPKDYDPVRFYASKMIGLQLNEIGIRTMVIDEDFSVLVGKMTSMNYDMVVLGWSISADPIYSVFDIIGPMSSTNAFGFWPEESPNPFYSDLGEVSTLADEETQELAREFMQMDELAKGTMDCTEQMMCVRAGQDIIAEALPVSVLYYRTNAFATSNAWSGWLPYQGDLLNRFSLSNLLEGQSDRVFADATSDINIGLTAPKTFIAGETGYVYSIIIDDLGQPLPAGGMMMMIVYHLASGVTETTYIYTDAPTRGIETVDSAFIVPLTFHEEGYGTITVITGFDSESVSDSVTFTVMTPIPKALMLSVVVDDPILGKGDSTLITVTAEDEYGEPVEGAIISIDPALIGVGTVDADTASTDMDGVAQFVLSAPMDCGLVNAHELSTLRFNVSMLFNESMTVYSWKGVASCDVLIFNDAEPDWTMARVMDVSSTALNPQSDVATITIEAVDAYGNAVPDLPMAVSYSSDSVYEPVTLTTTDGTGSATVDVQIKEDASTGALHVIFAPMVTGGSVQADVTLTYIDEDAPPEDTMYGGYITYDSAQFMEPFAELGVQVHVWDSAGEPADTLASLMLSDTLYGTMTWSDLVNWDATANDWFGIDIKTDHDGFSKTTGGPLNTPFDEDNYWEWMYLTGGWLFWEWGTMTGVEITDGLLELSVYGTDVAPADLISSIMVVPDGMGWFDGVTECYRIEGPTTITSDYVLGRSYTAVAPTVFTYDQTLEARTVGDTTVSVWVQDQDGAPVEGADVEIYQNSGNADYKVLSSDYQPVPSFETDIDGYAEAVVVGEGRTSVPTRHTILCDFNVMASYPGSLSMTSTQDILIYTTPTRVEATPMLVPLLIGSSFYFEVMVCDGTEMDMSGVTVSVLSGDGMDQVITRAVNDDGIAGFPMDTCNITGTSGFLPILVWTNGPGLDSGALRMMVPVSNDVPDINMMAPYDGQVLHEYNMEIRFSVWDYTGLQSVVMTMDDAPMSALPISSGQQFFYFDETVPVLPGIHTLKVVATDTSGLCSERTVTFTVEIDLPTVTVERLPGASTYSTVNWDFEPFSDGLWSLEIHNFGLKAVDIVVYEVDYPAGTVSEVMQEKVMLKGADIDPSGIVYSTPFQMQDGHTYLISVTPMGSTGSYAVLETQFAA